MADSSEPDRKPVIEYPCNWDYRVIGEDEHKLRIAVAGIAGNVPYMLTRGNISKKARYLSLQLTIEVRDENERNQLFESLSQHEDVKYVL